MSKYEFTRLVKLQRNPFAKPEYGKNDMIKKQPSFKQLLENPRKSLVPGAETVLRYTVGCREVCTIPIVNLRPFFKPDNLRIPP